MGGGLGAKAVSLGQFDSFLDWLITSGDGKLPKDLYGTVAWNFWAVNLRADSIAQVPYAVYPVGLPEEDETEENAEDFEIDLVPYLWTAEAWLCLLGAAYWLKRANRAGLQGLQVLNSQTMRVKEWDADGPTVFEQKVGAKTKLYPAKEIVYFRSFNPDNDIGPGVSSGKVVTTESTLIKNASEWAGQFFERGAIPATILWTEGQVPDPELERIRTAWEKLTKGVQKAWRTIVLRKGLRPEVIGMPVKDLAMPELERTKKEQILAGHKIPPGLAEAKTNRAERSALQFEFWTQCIKPEVQVWLKPAVNEQLLNPLGLRINWDFKQIEAIQAAELEKAEAMAFAIGGVALPAHTANVMSVDEVRSWIDAVGQAANLPALDEEFTPEERVAPQPFGGPAQEGPGTSALAENVEARSRPKAQAPVWGHHRISLPS
jgi:HK97 family phage portal protein